MIEELRNRYYSEYNRTGNYPTELHVTDKEEVAYHTELQVRGMCPYADKSFRSLFKGIPLIVNKEGK